jgi:DNA-binding transcriptional LysR family regulator
LTQSAISRQVQALEAAVGVPLFVRRHRALELTEAGRQLQQAVGAALTTLRSTVAQLRTPRRRAAIALTTTPGLASLWLIPRLSSFLRDHPTVDVRIDASLTRRDLAADGFDLAIRYARIGQAAGTPLFAETTLPVCAPMLLRDRTRPLATPTDLRRHTLLQVVVPPGSSVPVEWQPWLEAAGLGALEPEAMLSFSNYDAAVAAAVAGQGVALGRRPLIDDILKRKQLVAPFSGARASLASERAYFVQVAPAARERADVQALVRWLIEHAAMQDTAAHAVHAATRVAATDTIAPARAKAPGRSGTGRRRSR